MNLLRTAVLAAAALAGGAVALAGDLEWALGNLSGELQFRRDNLYEGTLDKVQKKELKAIEKSLAIVEDFGETNGDHLKATSKIVKTLGKAFPAEFNPGEGPTPFPNYLDDIVNYLRSDLNSEYSYQLSRGFIVPEGSPLWEKLNQILVDASTAIGDSNEATDFLGAMDAMERANKLLVKADRLLDKFESEAPK